MNPVQQNTVSQSKLFMAGRIKYFIKNWEELTTDSFILNVVMGCKIDLLHTPHQHYFPNEKKFSGKEKLFVQEELAKLLHKHVIIPSKHEKDEFVSTIFLTPKKDGSFRLILNLKKFNHFVRYQHFKMESLKQVIQLMKPGCFMASLHIHDAYYTVPIHSTHQKYLKFSFNGQLFHSLVCQMAWHVSHVYSQNCLNKFMVVCENKLCSQLGTLMIPTYKETLRLTVSTMLTLALISLESVYFLKDVV